MQSPFSRGRGLKSPFDSVAVAGDTSPFSRGRGLK